MCVISPVPKYCWNLEYSTRRRLVVRVQSQKADARAQRPLRRFLLAYLIWNANGVSKRGVTERLPWQSWHQARYFERLYKFSRQGCGAWRHFWQNVWRMLHTQLHFLAVGLTQLDDVYTSGQPRHHSDEPMPFGGITGHTGSRDSI